MNKSKTGIFVFLSVIVIAVTAGANSIYAVGQAVNPTKVALQANRCEMVTTRINNIITRFDANKVKHVEQYKNIHNRVADLISKLEAKGYDVTKLKADLAILSSKRQTFVDQYVDFIEALNLAKQHECGNSAGQFKGEVEAARALLNNARETSLEIRSFTLTTIKADIQAIRAQKPAN